MLCKIQSIVWNEKNVLYAATKSYLPTFLFRVNYRFYIHAFIDGLFLYRTVGQFI